MVRNGSAGVVGIAVGGFGGRGFARIVRLDAQVVADAADTVDAAGCGLGSSLVILGPDRPDQSDRLAVNLNLDVVKACFLQRRQGQRCQIGRCFGGRRGFGLRLAGRGRRGGGFCGGRAIPVTVIATVAVGPVAITIVAGAIAIGIAAIAAVAIAVAAVTVVIGAAAVAITIAARPGWIDLFGPIAVTGGRLVVVTAAGEEPAQQEDEPKDQQAHPQPATKATAHPAGQSAPAEGATVGCTGRGAARSSGRRGRGGRRTGTRAHSCRAGARTDAGVRSTIGVAAIAIGAENRGAGGRQPGRTDRSGRRGLAADPRATVIVVIIRAVTGVVADADIGGGVRGRLGGRTHGATDRSSRATDLASNTTGRIGQIPSSIPYRSGRIASLASNTASSIADRSSRIASLTSSIPCRIADRSSRITSLTSNTTSSIADRSSRITGLTSNTTSSIADRSSRITGAGRGQTGCTGYPEGGRSGRSLRQAAGLASARPGIAIAGTTIGLASARPGIAVVGVAIVGVAIGRIVVAARSADNGRGPGSGTSRTSHSSSFIGGSIGRVSPKLATSASGISGSPCHTGSCVTDRVAGLPRCVAGLTD